MSQEEIKLSEKEQAKLNKLFEMWMYEDQKKKNDNFKELNKTVVPDGIVFAGDSITEAYPLNELFPKDFVLYNRGIGGITSTQLLDNVDSFIIDLKPRKVFLLIGTNDIERDDFGNNAAKNIESICKLTLAALPDVKIYVISIYPVNETEKFKGLIGHRSNSRIIEMNHNIKKSISLYSNVTYIDLFDYLLQDRNLMEAYTIDGLHLSIKGFRAVTEKLLPYLK